MTVKLSLDKLGVPVSQSGPPAWLASYDRNQSNGSLTAHWHLRAIDTVVSCQIFSPLPAMTRNPETAPYRLHRIGRKE
jgi:hypothetical protein